jgi:hypothetical protein
MTLTIKIYIALAALVLVSALGFSIWSDQKTRRLERSAQKAREAAEQSRSEAAALEMAAAEYKRKNEYLEEQLSALRLIAVKQDEELEKFNTETSAARGRVRDARAVRAIESTTAELCARLADLGHPCE